MQKFRSRTILLFIVGIIACVSFSGCAPRNTRNVVRLNDSGSFLGSVSTIIRLKGMIEQYLPDGVVVEWTSIVSSSDVRDAIAAGRIDIGNAAAPTFISAYENNLPIRLISAASRTPTKLYSNNPVINSFQDLTNSSRIAISTKGNLQHLAFLIRSDELFENAIVFDNTLVPISAPNALASIRTGTDLDAALFIFPDIIVANEIEGIRIIEDLTSIVIDYNISSYFLANDEFAKNNPTIIEAFEKAAADAVEFMTTNPAEAARVLAEFYEIEARHVEEALIAAPPRLEVYGYDRIANVMYEARLLDKRPTLFRDLPNYDDIPKIAE